MAFDTHEFSEKIIPSVKFEDEGRTIRIPIADEKEGFDVKYQKLTFNGERFVEN